MAFLHPSREETLDLEEGRSSIEIRFLTFFINLFIDFQAEFYEQ